MKLAEKILSDLVINRRAEVSRFTALYLAKEVAWLTYCYAKDIDPATTVYTSTFLEFYNKQV